MFFSSFSRIIISCVGLLSIAIGNSVFAYESKGEDMEDPDKYLSFESVTLVSQLKGCWERIQVDTNLQPNPNKIEIYPFEEPRYQYFCFESARKLYTLLTTSADKTLRDLKKMEQVFPCVERYSIPIKGVVEIVHLDADTTYRWVSSLARVKGKEEAFGMRDGDLLMTIRHAETGEDLYFRHLRKMK